MPWKVEKGEKEAEAEKGRTAPQVYFGLCAQLALFHISLMVENHRMTEEAEWEVTHTDKSLTYPDYVAVVCAVYVCPFCFPPFYLSSFSLQVEILKMRQLILLKLKIKSVLLTFFTLQ